MKDEIKNIKDEMKKIDTKMDEMKIMIIHELKNLLKDK
jgi:hypothetical protein